VSALCADVEPQARHYIKLRHYRNLPEVDTGCPAGIRSAMFNFLAPALCRLPALSKRGCRGILLSTRRCPAITAAVIAVFSGGSLMSQPAQPGTPVSGAGVNRPNTTVVTNYHGWTKAILLSNGRVEALIVPEAGRIMQFRFAGSGDGPFWENAKLYGTTSSTTNWNTPGAIGGDKSWPAPQSDWPRHTPWSPPFGFDGNPCTCGITNGVVTLTGVVDADYQIRVTRTIELDPDLAFMRIKTVFQRVNSTSWTNKPVSVWVITQVRDPVGIYVPVPSPSIFPGANYFQLGRGLPARFQNTNGLISFTRDLAAESHLGFDANSLAWVGTNCAMRIDAPRVAGLSKTNYANGGCNTVVYTNRGTDAPYVELECFGPLTTLLPGQSTEFVTTYALFHRTEVNPETEARKLLELPPR
jgi:hypothetical protein